MEARHVSSAEWMELARSLKQEGWWLADLTGLDRLGAIGDGHRFDVVVQLLHRERKERGTIHIAAEGDPLAVPSAVGVWQTIDFIESEVFDLFGIVYDGHPNLRRIMMPDEWEGHPLRKDYGVGKVQIEFREQPFIQLSAPGQSARPAEAGVGLDELGQPDTASSDDGDPFRQRSADVPIDLPETGRGG